MGNNAVIYARISTDDGRQDADNQVDILRDLAQRSGLKITKEYVDRASGGTGDREAFQQMFKDLEKKSGTTLLFFSLDRLTREGALKTLSYLEQLDNFGIPYKSATETWLDSAGPFKVVIIAMLATLAKQEKVRIGERTRAGMARVKREGTRSGKPVGRPVAEIDLERARVLLRDHSLREAALVLGVPKSTLLTKLNGRSEKKLAPIWSEAVFGKIRDGVFQEEAGGDVVLRYNRRDQKAYCINHQVELVDCMEKHL